MKLTVIDLDGVCVDSSARFAKAEEAKQDFLKHHLAPANLDGSRLLEQKANDIYWRTAFTPSLVDGAFDALQLLAIGERNGDFRLQFLTSRPETMRAATLDWLRSQHLPVPLWNERLTMKPLSQQYVKTVTWKSGTIEVLARVLSADEVLVIDDEHAQQLAADLAGLDCFKVTCVASLAEAVATIGE